MTAEQKEILRLRSRHRVLTDDWAPVENMMAPVARRAARDFIGERLEQQARGLFEAGSYDQSIEKYRELLKLNRALWTFKATNQIALIEATQGKFAESVASYRAALAFNQTAEYQEDTHVLHLNLGGALNRLGHPDEAQEHLTLALPGLLRSVQNQPTSLAAIELLGDTHATLGRWQEAGRAYAQALSLEPRKIPNHLKMSQSLELLGQVDESFAVVDQLLEVLARQGRHEEVEQVQKYRQSIESRQALGKR